MKILPQRIRDDSRVLGICTSVEIATGGLLTALLIRWIHL